MFMLMLQVHSCVCIACVSVYCDVCLCIACVSVYCDVCLCIVMCVCVL